MTSGNERHRLFVVHRHATERLSNVFRGGNGIRVAVRPFRVHVDEAHLHGGERILELPVSAVALVAEPRGLRAPVDVLNDRSFPGFSAVAGDWSAVPLGGFTFGLFTIPPHSLEGGGPRFHTADTIDFEYVVSGEVWLELDDGPEVRLRPGGHGGAERDAPLVA